MSVVKLSQRLRETALLPAMRWPLAMVRLWSASTKFRREATLLVRWTFRSREWTNPTYDLTRRNRLHLAHTISALASIDVAEVLKFFQEIEQDEVLTEHVRITTEANEEAAVSDAAVRLGGRIGWYALVRALRPAVVVEAGLDKGLGALVIATALGRNSADGHPGRYIGIELKPHKGWLVGGAYEQHVELRFGDAPAVLENLGVPVDMYISETAAGADLERREYEAVSNWLTNEAVVIGGMAHATDELMEFSAARSARFVAFREDPHDHWHRGSVHGYAIGPWPTHRRK